MAFSLFKRLPLMLLISAFIALDFTLLFINLNLTHRLDQDANIINLTGRQRMLSQKVSKHLLQYTYSDEVARQDSLQALTDAGELFSTTLKALQQGGNVVDADGQTRTVAAIHDALSQQYIKSAQTHWAPIQATIELLHNGGVVEKAQIDEFTSHNSNEILDLMNRLTIRSEHISKANSETLRIAQIIVFLLVLVNFFTIVMRLIYINHSQEKMQEQLQQMVQNLAEAVILVDVHNTIVFANDAAARIVNEAPDDMIGQPVANLLGPISKGDTVRFNEHHYRTNTALITTVPHELRMISLIDITEQHYLKKQSTEDALTGLQNRIGLSEAYVQLCNRTEDICCLFLDLDGFKKVNDQYGHAVGDMALHIVSQRFRACLKSSDILARIGGDEFVIVIEQPASKDGIEHLCERIEDSIKKPMVIDGKRCHVGVSIGIQYSNCHEHSLDEIVRLADQKMYRVKQTKVTA